MDEWIDWNKFPVPEDVKGILIKYEDGVFSDRYDHKTKYRIYRESKIVGWKFIERRDESEKSIQCNQPKPSKRKDFEKLADNFLDSFESDRGGNWETENGYLLAIQEFSSWLNQNHEHLSHLQKEGDSDLSSIK